MSEKKIKRTRIAIAGGSTVYYLEEAVNKMLKSLEEENDIVDIKYFVNSVDNDSNYYCYTAMIIFRER